jgi:hypothetical protein
MRNALTGIQFFTKKKRAAEEYSNPSFITTPYDRKRMWSL